MILQRRPYADLLVEQQYTAFVARVRPDLADATLAPTVDPISTLFFGYRHLSPAVVVEPGDDRAPLENPEQPTGRPGSRAPHVRLRRSGGLMSTVDLFGHRFVVLTGPGEQAWVQAAEAAGAALGIELDVHQIGDPQGPDDVDGCWARRYGVGESGAVLVRPDGFVAWRGSGAPEALERVLRTVLDREA